MKCARRNTAEAGGRVYEGDLYEPLPPALRGRVDILLANVPYVPTEAIRLLPAEARMYEARLALDGERMGSMSCGGWRPKPGAGCRREVACW
ncbi:hypothetical protein LJK87_13570 [Paenibacillus sp. P25]|nr:hypothetical protein LJK87_13570 [Paenibacillus sp. P25]